MGDTISAPPPPASDAPWLTDPIITAAPSSDTALDAPWLADPIITAAPPRGAMGLIARVLPTPEETAGLMAGKDRALRDLTDRPAAWLARASDYLGLTHGQGDQVAAGNTTDRQAYDDYAAQHPTADTGRLVGQGLLTLPIAGAVGKVAGAAGDVIAAGTGRIAPALETGVNTAAEIASGTAGGPGSVGTRALQAGSVVTQGALQGGTAGALTAGQSDAPVTQQVLHGAEFGAVAAPVAKTIGAGLDVTGSFLKGDVNPEVQRLANLARTKYGINLTADQISPSPAVQYAGSVLRQVPGSGMAPAQAALQTQFTKAVGKTIGEDVDQITPAVMERAAGRIGGVMDDVANQTQVIPAGNLTAGLNQVGHDASFLTPDQQGVIGKQIDNVQHAIDANGNITGEQYQSLTKFNSPLGRALRSSDSDVRSAAIDIRGHLDDALEQSLPPGSQLMQQLKDARLQYKNLKTIEPLVTKGEPGEISPTLLQGQVNKSFKSRGMREAQPDLGEIADIGRRFNLQPNSGTAPRAMANAALVGVGSGINAIMSGDLKNALTPLGVAAATVGAGRVGGSILRNRGYINSLLDAPTSPAAAPVLNQLTSLAAPTAAIVQGRTRKAITAP